MLDPIQEKSWMTHPAHATSQRGQPSTNEMSMLRQLVLCAALITFGADTARSACAGQTGKPIFADDFSDDSGGWDLQAGESYVPGALQVKTSPQLKGTGSINQTFSAVDADYCAVIVFPADPPEPGNSDYVSLFMLASDYQNWFSFTVRSDSVALVTRYATSVSTPVFSLEKISAINTNPGAENTLRVIVKGQKMTFLVNGVQIKTIRAQTPDIANKFGFFAGSVNAITKDRMYLVKSFSVAEAP